MRIPLVVLFTFISVAAFAQQKADTIVVPANKTHFIWRSPQKCFVADWSQLYADKLCHVFNSQAEVNAYYKCPFVDSIDFDEYTLVHYPQLNTNKEYHIKRTIKIVGSNIVEEIVIVKPKLEKGEGITMVGAVYFNDILIPKLNGKYNAVLVSKEIEVDDFYKNNIKDR